MKMNTKNKNFIQKYFADWNIWEKSWLIVSLGIMFILSMYWQSNIISIIASLTGIITVVLVAKGRISNYYFGFVNVVLYAYVAFQWQYYGEVMLNVLYFFPMQIYGLWYWTQFAKSTDKVYVKRMTLKQIIVWIIVIIIAVIGYAFFLDAIGGSLPIRDSVTTILSIVAMIFMARLYIEQWVLWILVNIFSIYMWLETLWAGGSDIAILVMWSAYLVNAVYGLTNWILLYNKQA